VQGVLTSSGRAQPSSELRGLYWAYLATSGFSHDFQGNPHHTRDYTLHRYCFVPNAGVYIGLPLGGLESVNCNARDAKVKSVCQSYRISGGTIQFGNDKPVRFKCDGSRLEIGEEVYTPVSKLEGLKLDAVYSGQSYAQTTGVSATNVLTYTFKSEGTFERQSASTVSSTTDPNNTQDSRTGTSFRKASDAWGTHRYFRNTLELKLKDDQLIRLTAVMLFADRSWRGAERTDVQTASAPLRMVVLVVQEVREPCPDRDGSPELGRLK
jgi:hypothetical protein